MEFVKNELLSVFILTTLVAFAYWPFISGFSLNIGGSDARWYQYILHDAILQLNHGIFPTYVSQSEFSFFGGPVTRAPYYLLFGQLINILTFNQLNALCIQHLTVLVSAFGAAYLTYFLLASFSPKLKWFAVSLAFFYVSCPGIMGLIYRYDMYYSFMTVPFLPLVIYGLVRSHQREDLIGPILTALGLSLTWLSHPPIALWLTGVVVLFHLLRFIVLRKGLRECLIIFALFFFLNLWQFICVFSMGVGNRYGSDIVTPPKEIVELLSSVIPGVFVPLQWSTGLSFFQLGYAFIFILLLSLLTKFHSSNRFLLYTLLACVFCFLLLLYPLPFIGYALWSLIPGIVINMTDIPMFRFYMIIAAIVCFIGIIVLNSISSKYSKIYLPLLCVFILLTIWNVYQANYFVSSTGSNTNSWLDEKNVYFTPGQTPQYVLLSDGNYDPNLKNQIVNNRKIPYSHYDNEQFVINKCFASEKARRVNSTTPANHDVSKWAPLFKFKATSNEQYLLCLNIKSQSVSSMIFRINGEVVVAQANAGNRNIAVPFYIHQPKNKELAIEFDNIQGASPVKIIKAGLIKYHPKDLPIQINSFTPYQATVKTPSNNTYLKIFKSFYPGYEAKVNNEIVPVLESNNHTIVIPLKHKGLNKIQLQYIGFSAMKISFYVSMFTWCFVLGCLLFNIRKQKLLQKYSLDFVKG